MDFFLIANFSRENVPTVTWDVCRELAARGCGVFVAPVPGAVYPPNVQVINMESTCAHTDMILCIGGDGTIIDGAHYSAAHGLRCWASMLAGWAFWPRWNRKMLPRRLIAS